VYEEIIQVMHLQLGRGVLICPTCVHSGMVPWAQHAILSQASLCFGVLRHGCWWRAGSLVPRQIKSYRAPWSASWFVPDPGAPINRRHPLPGSPVHKRRPSPIQSTAEAVGKVEAVFGRETLRAITKKKQARLEHLNNVSRSAMEKADVVWESSVRIFLPPTHYSRWVPQRRRSSSTSYTVACFVPDAYTWYLYIRDCRPGAFVPEHLGGGTYALPQRTAIPSQLTVGRPTSTL